MMDLEQIEVLERKIGQAVRLIEQLKSQNQKLENDFLTSR